MARVCAAVLVLLVLALVCAIVSNASILTLTPNAYTFRFSQSLSGFTVWTTPNTRRIISTDTTAPTATGTTLPISCAKNELESFQVVIAPTSTYTTMTVSLGTFSALGATATYDVGVATFSAVSGWGQGGYTAADYTDPVASGGTVTLSSTLPTVLWMTVTVPTTATAGPTTTTLTLTPNGHAAVAIPISLYVFNFALSTTVHFDTYMMSLPTIEASTLADRDVWKKVYKEHRLFAPDMAWPTGLNWEVAWNCATSSLVDCDSTTSAESCVWANGCNVQRYHMGYGTGTNWRGSAISPDVPAWVGTGFPSVQAVSTDRGRPDPFCDVPCDTPAAWGSSYSGWMCSAAYEAKWGQYLLALKNYLTNTGMYASSPTKGYWYTQNEPQNWHDYTISAYLCTMARQYAPGLKIMLSREAQPAIAERSDFGSCSYDIWIAHAWRFTTTYTWKRQVLNGETSWFYTLDTDNLCVFPGVCNGALTPAVSDTGSNGAEDPIALNSGPHYRLLPWAAWSNRITGWGYYKDNIWWDTRATAPAPSRPKISASMLREGLEDYEYLYIANGNSRPGVYQTRAVDAAAISLAYAFGIWYNDSNAIYQLRHELGRFAEGTRADVPTLTAQSSRAFGNYYIDFADTTSNPTHTPISYGGKSWIPIGWDAYTVANGFGWNSAYMGLPDQYDLPNMILLCADAGEGTLVTSTYCFNNYGKADEFHFQVAPGVYNVSVAVGIPGRCRAGDFEFVSANNAVLRNFSCAVTAPATTTCCGARVYWALATVQASAAGGVLVVTFANGIDYTMFSWMSIEGVSQTATSSSTGSTRSSSSSTGSSTRSSSSTGTITTASSSSTASTLRSSSTGTGTSTRSSSSTGSVVARSSSSSTASVSSSTGSSTRSSSTGTGSTTTSSSSNSGTRTPSSSSTASTTRQSSSSTAGSVQSISSSSATATGSAATTSTGTTTDSTSTSTSTATSATALSSSASVLPSLSSSSSSAGVDGNSTTLSGAPRAAHAVAVFTLATLASFWLLVFALFI